MAASFPIYDNGRTALAGFALAVLFAFLASNFFRLKTDPREPPVIYPRIPFIGHIIGLVREGPIYINKLRCVPAIE